MGHLLYLLGNVNKRTMHKYEQEAKKAGKASFAYAWVLDETGEERDRCVQYKPIRLSFLFGKSDPNQDVFVYHLFCFIEE